VKTKIRISNSSINSAICQWITVSIKKHLQTFINRYLRVTLQVRWLETISNQDLWRRRSRVPVEEEIKRRKWGRLGHTLRKPHVEVNRTTLECNPQGSGRRGGPSTAWWRSVHMETKALGLNCSGVKAAARNRVRWRCEVWGGCPVLQIGASYRKHCWTERLECIVKPMVLPSY
jgi:hypothetical protein